MPPQDLAYQVGQTLAEFADTFEVSAIVEEIGNTYGYDIKNIDAIPSDEYWEIVKRHSND
jgi:hypothetical protein